MGKLERIERERQIVLPDVYKEFYRYCSLAVPEKLVGTDLFNHYPKLNEWAVELLENEGLKNFIEKDDFIFMMHQGYMFWYFKANGNPDPIVYYYLEQKSGVNNQGVFSSFIRQYIE